MSAVTIGEDALYQHGGRLGISSRKPRTGKSRVLESQRIAYTWGREASKGHSQERTLDKKFGQLCLFFERSTTSPTIDLSGLTNLELQREGKAGDRRLRHHSLKDG